MNKITKEQSNAFIDAVRYEDYKSVTKMIEERKDIVHTKDRVSEYE